MAFLYKTLCEVRLLHEFYVTEADGSSAFAQPDQAHRLGFLMNQFSLDRETIDDDLQFEFPESHQKKYDGYCLRIIQGYSGFKLVTRVTQQVLPDNSLVYQPFNAFPNDLNIFISINRKNDRLDGLTSGKITNPYYAGYFFSNEAITTQRNFPFLTSPISDFDSSISYEQGELASFGVNDIRSSYRDGSGDQWDPVTGIGFANENDRLIVPYSFYYTFINQTGITQATFNLNDKNGNSIKTITVTSTTSLSKVWIDFSSEKKTISLPDTFLFPDVIYSLEVSADNGYSRTHSVIFSDELSMRNRWGIIDLRNVVSNSQFNLLAADGFLFKRRNSAGVWQDPPTYEIPIKSRYAYWRYSNDKGKELKLTTDFTNYLEKESNILLTLKPRSLTKYYFLVQKSGSTDTKYIPNPVNYELKEDDKDRLILDVLVPQSSMFPVMP